MDKQRIKDEADAFFEWPTPDKTHVTTTSALIFASVMAGVAEQEERAAIVEWRNNAEAVLRKIAADGWITDELHSKEGRAALIDKLLSLKREARGVLSPPNLMVRLKDRGNAVGQQRESRYQDRREPV